MVVVDGGVWMVTMMVMMAVFVLGMMGMVMLVDREVLGGCP